MRYLITEKIELVDKMSLEDLTKYDEIYTMEDTDITEYTKEDYVLKVVNVKEISQSLSPNTEKLNRILNEIILANQWTYGLLSEDKEKYKVVTYTTDSFV